MNPKERQKITTNEQYLCDNVKVSDITPHLIQNSVISWEDEQRIGFLSTDGEKVHKLLRILEEHEKGFEYFCKALRNEHMEHAADALEITPVDEKAIEREQQWSDQMVDDILKKNFCCEANHQVYLGSIIEDIRFEFRQNGYTYHIHDEHINRRILNTFPNVSSFKHKKKKEWIFRNLRRMSIIKEQATNDTTINIDDKKNTDGTSGEQVFQTSRDNIEKCRETIDSLSPNDLVQLISPRFDQYDIPKDTSQLLIEGGITGRNFKQLKIEYMPGIFPNFSKGNTLSFLSLRDEILEEELTANILAGDKVALSSSHIPTATETVGNFKEVFRQFDKAARSTDCYRQGAILTTSNTRPSNLLEPLHVFSKVTMHGKNLMYDAISDEVVEFAAACINERSNGTIHFGIVPQQTEFRLDGLVKGLLINREDCLRSIYRKMEDRFYKDEISLVFRCMRPPQFIEVSSKTRKRSGHYVLEIDIIPDSALLKEEAFFIKEKNGRQPLLFLFNESGISPKHLTDEQARIYMSKTKNLISDCRKNHEKKPPYQQVKPDLRQKMLDCLSSGEERMSSDIYPLLFLSPLSKSEEDKTSMDNFEFLVDLDANAIFDFDYSKEYNGIYRYMEAEKCQVFTALTTDNFDPHSSENQRLRDTHSNLLEDMKQSHIKPWIFCNGYEPMCKASMSRKEWKQNRMKGFKEAIRFYCNEIPSDRALVIFFLFSKNYDIMLEAAEEVILNFQDQWVVIAENAEIASHWCYELERRETVDKKDISKRAILGMPWNHVNQTIQQLYGVNRPIRCEIPTSTGAFCHLNEKHRNKLHNLEIVSRNECDDPEIMNDGVKLSIIRRNVAETFYRGGAVSWWNFWFPDHVLKREVHKKT